MTLTSFVVIFVCPGAAMAHPLIATMGVLLKIKCVWPDCFFLTLVGEANDTDGDALCRAWFVRLEEVEQQLNAGTVPGARCGRRAGVRTGCERADRK